MAEIEDLTRSVGAKRTVASLLEILNRLFWWIPGIGDVISYLALFFGIAGITHSAGEKTILKVNKASTLAVTLGLIVKMTLLLKITALYPYLTILNQLIVAFGGAAIANYLNLPKPAVAEFKRTKR